jgi:hypothetical protein
MVDKDLHGILMGMNVGISWGEAGAWNRSGRTKMEVNLGSTLDPALSHTNTRRMLAALLWVGCNLDIAIAVVVAFRHLKLADEQQQSPL